MDDKHKQAFIELREWCKKYNVFLSTTDPDRKFNIFFRGDDGRIPEEGFYSTLRFNEDSYYFHSTKDEEVILYFMDGNK